MRPPVLVSLIGNPALLADVLESARDMAPPAVRRLHFRASGGRFPRISTVFEYQPALGEVVRRFGSWERLSSEEPGQGRGATGNGKFPITSSSAVPGSFRK